MTGDGVEPGGSPRLVAECPDMPPCFDERLLGEVFGDVRTISEVRAQPDEPPTLHRQRLNEVHDVVPLVWHHVFVHLPRTIAIIDLSYTYRAEGTK